MLKLPNNRALVEQVTERLNNFGDYLCHTGTKNSKTLDLFYQLEKNMMAIQEFDRFMKITEKNKAAK